VNEIHLSRQILQQKIKSLKLLCIRAVAFTKKVLRSSTMLQFGPLTYDRNLSSLIRLASDVIDVITIVIEFYSIGHMNILSLHRKTFQVQTTGIESLQSTNAPPFKL
jgi:hypothetical protein